MKRCWSIALLWTACAIAAHGQSPLTVGYQKTLQLPIAGVTAAYSLDSNIADATATNGLVDVVGKAPGTTNIVVVTPAGAQTIAVFIPTPPPVLPPGFEPPERLGSGEPVRGQQHRSGSFVGSPMGLNHCRAECADGRRRKQPAHLGGVQVQLRADGVVGYG